MKKSFDTKWFNFLTIELFENILSDRSRSSPTLSSYDTCGFLEMDLKGALERKKCVLILVLGSYYYGGGWG